MTSALKGGSVQDFSAGPNLRDAAPKLAVNESSDAWNVTFDERGDVASRLGYVKDNTDLYPDPIVNMDWIPLLGTKVVQAGTDLYLESDPTTSVQTFSTNGTVTFAELNDHAIACHPVDGIFTSTDGSTWTVVADADAPTAPLCCVTWQGRLIVGLAKGKVFASDFGDATSWTSTSFNNLWEIDQRDIVALHVASGQDIIGQAGLVACKQDSSYLITDPATLDYSTIDATVGAAGPLAITGVGPKVITLSKRGICWWQQGQIGFANASDRLFPLWQADQLNFGEQSKWCAGRKLNRAIFSLTRHGSSVNDLALEFHPDQDWIAPRSDAMTCYTTSSGNVEALYGGSPTVDGQAYVLDSGGTDDGAAISYRFQTRWFQLNDGYKAVLWQIRLHGRGAGTFFCRKDYAAGGGISRDFSLSSDTLSWDDGLSWDSGLMWDEGLTFQQSQPFFSFGACREFSLLFEGNVSTTASGPQVLGVGTAPVLGAFGLSTIVWLFTPLGLS